MLTEVPPDPRTLRARVSTDTRNMLLGLAVVALLTGAFGIANTMVVAVWERRMEIGVRRALGIRRRTVAALFIAESALVGLGGGLTGLMLGIIAAAVVAHLHAWTLAVPPFLPAAPLLGIVVGILAGCYPAWRASRLDPVNCLR